MGPSASAGRKVSPATTRTTPTTKPPKSGVWVGKVPALAGTTCLRAIEPAIASTGMISRNRPISIASP